MPWATGAFSPRACAYASFRCVGLKSPDTAANPSSSVLVSVRDRLAEWPTSISANVRFSTTASSLMIGSRPEGCISARPSSPPRRRSGPPSSRQGLLLDLGPARVRIVPGHGLGEAHRVRAQVLLVDLALVAHDEGH